MQAHPQPQPQPQAQPQPPPLPPPPPQQQQQQQPHAEQVQGEEAPLSCLQAVLRPVETLFQKQEQQLRDLRRQVDRGQEAQTKVDELQRQLFAERRAREKVEGELLAEREQRQQEAARLMGDLQAAQREAQQLRQQVDRAAVALGLPVQAHPGVAAAGPSLGDGKSSGAQAAAGALLALQRDAETIDHRAASGGVRATAASASSGRGGSQHKRRRSADGQD